MRPTSRLRLVVVAAVVALAAGAGCAGRAEALRADRAITAAPSGPRRYVVAASGALCGGAPASRLTDAVQRSADLLAAALAGAVRVTSGPALLAEVAARDPRPLIVFYIGRGTVREERVPASRRVRRRSELCLPEGPLSVDDVLAATDPGVPYTVFVLDACASADVDVRRSPVPTAVLSASPGLVAGDVADTALGCFRAAARVGIHASSDDGDDDAAPYVPRCRGGIRGGRSCRLLDALACADANGDGVVDDGELVDEIQEMAGQPLGEQSLQPRLRRQSWSALPVVALTRAPASPAWHAWIQGGDRDRLLTRERSFVDGRSGSYLEGASVFWVVHGDAARAVAAADPCGSTPSLRCAARELRASEGFALDRRGGEEQLRRARDGAELFAFPPEREPGVVERIERGDWALLGNDPYGPVVWHGGKVGAVVRTLDGVDLPGEDLVPIWCPSERIGQCFAVVGPSARRRSP